MFGDLIELAVLLHDQPRFFQKGQIPDGRVVIAAGSFGEFGNGAGFAVAQFFEDIPANGLSYSTNHLIEVG